MVRRWLFLFVLLLSISHASAVNQVTNGNFENNLTGWTFVPDAGGSSYAQINSGDKYEGSYSATLRSYGISTTGHPWYAHIYQDIDLTGVSNLTLMLKSVIMNHDYPDVPPYPYDTSYFEVWINNTCEYHVEDSTFNWSAIDIDVSAYSSTKRVYFRVGGESEDGDHWESKVYVDNIVANDGTPPTVNIDTKTTYLDIPLTGIIVNCENNTGGFPNENGYRYLTPNEKASKEYIIYLLGDDLQGGFELNLWANSADITKLTIDVEDLSSSRTYDVYFDDNYIESINGITTYEYDITSFSSHTLELRYVASIEAYVTNVAGSTYIQDADSTGGFVDDNGYITLTPEIADSYPLTIENDLSDGIKLIFTSSDIINSMPLTFYGFDASEDYKFYLDGTLISTISSSIFYYDVITHDEITTTEFVKCLTSGGGDNNNGEEEEQNDEEEDDTGIIIIDDEIIDIIIKITESKLDEDLVESLILTEPIKTVTTFIKEPVNWLILLGAYLGILIGMLLTSKVNYPSIFLYGTITWIAVLILVTFGLNLFILNYIFSSTSILLATLNYTIYGILVSLFVGE